ncbi:MAG TPA: hypothetical protein G4N98_07685 [Thermoflexia bacterium]|nr:hypothetical protein [Thermoflexia bacterium]
MDIEFLIQRLEQYLLEECPKIPFSGSRAVSEAEVRSQLERLRQVLPGEVQQAQQIVQRRQELLQQAREEAQRILVGAERELEELLAEHQIVREARKQVKIIYHQAAQETATMRADADEYVFTVLSQLEEEMKRSLREVENGLARIESACERRLEDE